MRAPLTVSHAVGGRRGGEARKQQMAEQAGGDVSKAYSDMGQTGAVKGGYSTGYAHDEQKMKEVGATENRYETPPE